MGGARLGRGGREGGGGGRRQRLLSPWFLGLPEEIELKVSTNTELHLSDAVNFSLDATAPHRKGPLQITELNLGYM